jgi:hypothetical protein
MKLFLSAMALVGVLAVTHAARADKVAVLPFSSSNNVPRTELEQIRGWTREALTREKHTFATPDEMVSAEAAIRDGVADVSSEYIAAGKAAGAPWTLSGRVERRDVPPSKQPDGTEEEGYTLYRVELEACQVGSGRVESLAREVLPEEAPQELAEMIALLVRPEGLANAPIPWEKSGAKRPKPRPKPPAPPPPPPAPPPPAEPRPIYGQGHPILVAASIGVTNALVRPDDARGPSWAMPIGGAVGYALPDVLAGLELRGNLTGQVVGPRALEVSAGARWAFAPFGGVRLFVGPELLVGGHVALGANKTTRFLGHGSAFVAYGITENIQVELAGDLMTAFGGTGTLVLGGGTSRLAVRF